jgi:D-lactate dehydrogenase (cytochrome)
MVFHSLNEEDKATLGAMVSTDRFSTGSSNLDLHSRDMSRHRPRRPEAVIWPVDRKEVSHILKFAFEKNIPVTPWGAGTSLEGNPIPVEGGIVLNFNRMNRLLRLNKDDFQADLEPGMVYKELNRQLRHTGLFFPPDPGADATIGGMIANNASGTRTVRYGSTRNFIKRLVLVMANGEILEIGNRASKSSSGYDLINLFVGSEGTLGVVVEATVRLVGIPAEIACALATFKDPSSAAGAVFELMRSGIDPAALELLSTECIELINREKGLGLEELPTLFIELHGPTSSQLAGFMEIARELCQGEGCLGFRPGVERGERDRLFEARYALGETITQAHPGHRRITIDVAVPISAYPEMIGFAREAAAGVKEAVFYTFGHAGDGNIHLVFSAPARAEKVWDEIEEVNGKVVARALELGGTATGEHGVGIGKARFMPAEHGASLELMKQMKGLLDPKGILNPGKIFP